MGASKQVAEMIVKMYGKRVKPTCCTIWQCSESSGSVARFSKTDT